MNLFIEKNEGRPRALWRLLAQFVLFQLATVLFATPLALAWTLAGPGGAPGSGGQPPIFLIGIAASMAAVFLSVWLAGRFMDRRPFRDFGFHLDGGWWLDLLFGLLLGAALMTVIFLVELASGWVTVTGSFRSLVPGVPFVPVILLPLAAFLFVGIYEELMYRGYQLRNIAEGLNHPALDPRWAVLAAWTLSSVFFGVLHALNPNASLVSTFNIVLAGLMLGTAYVLTGELAAPIGLHIAWNFFQGTVFGLPVSGLNPVGATFISTEQAGPEIWTGGVFGPEGGLLVTFATLAGILLTALWVRLRHGRVSVHTPMAEYPKQVSASSRGSEG
ncbi:MAG: type II CAAX endopeptidase family protein [Rubrobacteraceae bacterium]